MRLRSRLSRALVAVTVALTVTLAPAGPASAGIWQLTDGFEPATNPASRWTPTAVGTCWGPYYTGGIGPARTGTGFAHWRVLYQPDWCSIGRTIRLSPVVGRTGVRCTAGIWARLRGGDPQLNVEVIDPDTWTYIALKTVPYPGWVAGWTLHTVTWTAQRPDVVLRFALLAKGNGPYPAEIELDDAIVQCTY
ncbi:hypothetical protein [Herbidospora mongoliensis]|uniref:hypothetical protein n=1 Tax=Herbidospora mongoliensis TaxID=688067 RepID=UPI00082C113A|nr:hypothetical protein [Herbidospora mongoliensis]